MFFALQQLLRPHGLEEALFGVGRRNLESVRRVAFRSTKLCCKRTALCMTPPPRILVVEDEPLIRMLAVDMLDILGFAVTEAATGREALAISSDDLNAMAALMIDLGLPDQPGEEVVRQLLEKRPDLPVIVTTGADTSQALSRIGDAHVVMVLEKPYQLKDLERTVAPLAIPG